MGMKEEADAEVDSALKAVADLVVDWSKCSLVVQMFLARTVW
jgi:hypothetical protein